MNVRYEIQKHIYIHVQDEIIHSWPVKKEYNKNADLHENLTRGDQ